MKSIRSANLGDGEVITVRVYEPRPVARFAEGGLARAAEAVRGRGRMGDDVLIHINPEEFQQLQKIWGEPSYNPHTGLPEYGFMSKLKKAVKSIGKSIVKSATPWTINKQDIEDIKHGEGIAGVGTPLHGLSAGYSAHKALSPTYHIKDRVDRLRNGEKLFSKEHLKNTYKDNHHYIQDAVKENKIPLMAIATAGLGAAGAAGNAADAGGALGTAGEAGGALNTVANVAGGAGSAIPAGIEGVTVTASGLGSGLSAADAAAGLGALGQVAHGVDSYQNPNEVKEYRDTYKDPNAPTAEELGIPEPSLPPEPSLWDRTLAYGSDMGNWKDIAGGVGAIGTLMGGGGAGGGGPPAPPDGFNQGTNSMAPVDYLGRSRTGDISDYYSYGAGPEFQFYDREPRPVGAARGGGIDLGYGQGGGALSRLVRGPGTGRSDDIPARLSDGEYVFDAETVALLGDGSTDEGARRLDALRKKLRMHKGKALSKGKFSSSAKNPEEYL
jgi:hypothetical protein